MRYLFAKIIVCAIASGGVACGDEITNITEEIIEESSSYEYLITDYGAVADGETDCSAAFKAAIDDLPENGGVIVVPVGDYLLDNPIEIDRNYVTIEGVNEGLRSNIDYDSETNPGGGSKLILGDASVAIKIVEGEDEGRISGVTISTLLISGGTPSDRRGTGISVVDDNDGIRLENIVCINLTTGMSITAADAMIISECWISECKNCIYMNSGIQNIISNCDLGGQPGGTTVYLRDQENCVFEGNQVYPDGDSNMILKDCTMMNISSNNFQSYYTGMLKVDGDNNLISDNIFWLRLYDDGSSQLNGNSEDYGVIRVEGDHNLISNSLITCEWSEYVTNPVTVRSVSGDGNRYSDLVISDDSGTRVFYVNEGTEIFDCVSSDKVYGDGDMDNVYVSYSVKTN